MPHICYQDKHFHKKTLAIIDAANEILEEYVQKGYDLTLRQLYYQFVARDFLPNTPKSYDNLGNVINNARLAGLIDWNHITDRTRYVRDLSHWDSPEGVVHSAAESFRVNMWEEQNDYVEVWIEKDALVGVITSICQQWDVPFLSCRGYVSQSEMWRASCRFTKQEHMGKNTFIIHLGDHDPSGVNMTADIQNRLYGFNSEVEVCRVALTMEQIEKYDPPPNYAKETDSRYRDYVLEYGERCWELDALEPEIIEKLVADTTQKHLNFNLWKEKKHEEEEAKGLLSRVVNRWEEVKELLND